MIYRETELNGAWVIEPEPLGDARGFFARLIDRDGFAAHGLTSDFPQVSMSFNQAPHTLRGLHLQRPPAAEAKLIRATAGAVFDVIVDLRAGSATYGKWIGIELSAANRRQLYVPEGFAHGFQTLSPESELLYHISTPFAPDLQDGVAWNDPSLDIAWPNPAGAILSPRDRNLGVLDGFRPISL